MAWHVFPSEIRRDSVRVAMKFVNEHNKLNNRSRPINALLQDISNGLSIEHCKQSLPLNQVVCGTLCVLT